ncbi:formylglycine-generating enzyme family protein [Fimbriimonas ginsengisoli]|uniref:Sulfatase-modifying factor enzyme-like domain-containing protein n=1 Tax=Fimbriimonas ginsengisoli Gsoil 348 TaxID=661478 RepID=A0A068NWJ6_FIMGI|nr:SUMF1/EgtB/PvdO family nonheme iron enzyme [Fimbriimonas ginsengisoli]AIE85969.1 hypothetical protein OP10G_2601 [Fimbriimonas ginsengisoli Gsoil 348]
MMPPEMPEVMVPPRGVAEREAWRKEIAAWRDETRKALNYDGAPYRRPEFQWAARCYACNKVMLWDETFLDPKSGRYLVEDYLREGERAFGGYDAVVLWHAYPRIGFDDRNQFDFYREMPGGLAGLREVVRRFHRRGVRVFVDYNPWDTGTRREPVTDAEALSGIVREIEADGVFLDTLNEGGMALRAAMDRARPGVAMESELALPVEGLPLNHLSWAQWFDPGDPPGVLRNRWIEPRHMMHLVRRWDTDHTNELHLAWMNGAGMLVWENVFGSWNPWSLRNRAMLRAILSVQRHFHPHFSQGDWIPLIETGSPEVHASEWRHGASRLWTIVNRGNGEAKGDHFDARLRTGERLFDLLTGREVHHPDDPLPATGIASYLAVPAHEVTEELRTFLAAQSHVEGFGVDTASRTRHPQPTIVAFHSDSPGTGLVVEAGEYPVVTRYRARECGERGYAHYENLAYPPIHQESIETRRVRLSRFALDPKEVTNSEYAAFLRESGYKPAHPQSFLKHWVAGQPVAGQERDPVVFVDLDDARAYAKWAGKRLPTDAEWQVAMERHRVDRGAKPVWNWTESEYSDGRTRFCLLKGGSWYQAPGSQWYADGGVRPPDFAAKFIRMNPGLDRCATVGFRCAK